MVSEISHNALSGKGVGSLHTKFPENYVYKDFFFFLMKLLNPFQL